MSYISKTEKFFRASRLDINFQVEIHNRTKKPVPSRTANLETRTFYSEEYKKYLRSKHRKVNL